MKWSLFLLLCCCQQPEQVEYEYPATIIIPADCSGEDSIREAKYNDSARRDEVNKEIRVKEKKIEGLKVKSILDSLAVVVDRYIALRDKSTDSVTWFRWEDSVKAHIAEGQILMNQKADKISDVDYTIPFKQGFRKSPTK